MIFPSHGYNVVGLLLTSLSFSLCTGQPINSSNSLQSRMTKEVKSVLSFPFQSNIVIVGNIFGNYEDTVAVLKAADVIDKKGDWSGNVECLVQTGNIVDYGVDGKKVYELFQKLRVQSRAAKGVDEERVINLLGRHEIMNVDGNWANVKEEDVRRWQGETRRLAGFRSLWPMNEFISDYRVAVRAPLHPLVGSPDSPYNPDFDELLGPIAYSAIAISHSGISPELELRRFPKQLNSNGADVLKRYQAQSKPAAVQSNPNEMALSPPDDVEDAGLELLKSPLSPLLYSGWTQASEDAVCRNADIVSDKTGTKFLVQSSVGDRPRVVMRCRGKVIILQSGDPEKYHSDNVVALKIEHSWTPKSSRISEGQNHVRYFQSLIFTQITTAGVEGLGTSKATYHDVDVGAA